MKIRPPPKFAYKTEEQGQKGQGLNRHGFLAKQLKSVLFSLLPGTMHFLLPLDKQFMYNEENTNEKECVSIMASYSKYTRKKDGKKLWMFKMYLGVDELTGKSIRISRRRSESGEAFETKSQAEAEVMHLESEYKKGKQKELLKETKRSGVKTFKEVADEWLEYRYKGTVKDSTYMATSEGYFKLHINPSLGKYKIDKISKRVLEEIVKEWSEKYRKYKYNLMVNYSKRVFKYAVEEGYIKRSPYEVTHVPKVRVERKPETEFYDKFQLKEFLDAAEEYGENGWYWNTFYHFLAFSGLRSGEARALTWGDVDFLNNSVDVNKTLSVRYNETLGKSEMYLSDSTKGGEDRIVVLDKITMKKLKGLRSSQPKDEHLVFPALNGHTGKWMYAQTANIVMKRIARKKNVKRIKIHEFRHTHCSLLFDAGVSIKEVQERLGHKDVTITLNIYTHVTQGRKNNVVDKLMEYVNET